MFGSIKDDNYRGLNNDNDKDGRPNYDVINGDDENMIFNSNEVRPVSTSLPSSNSYLFNINAS